MSIQQNNAPQQGETWETPTLQVLGSLEKLTQSTGAAGPGDGLFQDANS